MKLTPTEAEAMRAEKYGESPLASTEKPSWNKKKPRKGIRTYFAKEEVEKLFHKVFGKDK